MNKSLILNSILKRQLNCELCLGNNLKRYLSSNNSNNVSRVERYKTGERSFGSRNKVFLKDRINPKDTTVMLFPGQAGIEYVGMVSSIFDSTPTIRKMYEVSQQILGYDLLDMCLNGPIEKLSRTEYCQPAIFVASLAAVEHLRTKNPSAIKHCSSTAGFSVGEITSLVFSGAMKFEDGLRFVDLRAQAMQIASNIVPSGMAKVFLDADAQLVRALEASREWCKKNGIDSSQAVCSIANYLYPGCRVIAGHEEALKFIEMKGKDFGIIGMSKLPVSGAFHTSLMTEETQNILERALENIDFEMPRIRCYSNVTGMAYTNRNEIKKDIVLQISKPIKWERIIRRIYDRQEGANYPVTYECGPGNGLLLILKSLYSEAHDCAKRIEV